MSESQFSIYVKNQDNYQSDNRQILLLILSELKRFYWIHQKIYSFLMISGKTENNYAWKVSVLGVILVLIFPHSDWIRRDTRYLSVFSPNAGKYGPELTPNLSTFDAVFIKCIGWRFVEDFVSYQKYVVSAAICLYPIFREYFWLIR